MTQTKSDPDLVTLGERLREKPFKVFGPAIPGHSVAAPIADGYLLSKVERDELLDALASALTSEQIEVRLTDEVMSEASDVYTEAYDAAATYDDPVAAAQAMRARLLAALFPHGEP